jgi:poly(A) polymerase
MAAAKEIALGSFPQDWMAKGPARIVYDALEKAGGQPRFVGGCVRDGLLGRAIRDIDIATALPPSAVIEAAGAAGLKHAPTGLEHGTVTVIAEHAGIEVTTLRRDMETDGRHAVVRFTDDWREDAARRDLTINALSVDKDGAIYDYFDGVRDLRAGRVRFVGDPEARVREDYLRILRFFRFHADYAVGNFDQPALAATIAGKSHLRSLSGERLRQETLKLLTARRGAETWRAMLETGIAGAYLPEATSSDRLARLVKLESALRVVPDAIRRLAAVTVTGSAAVVAERLKLSNAERERLAAITAARPEFPVSAMNQVRRQIYELGNARALDLLLVDWAAHEPSDETMPQWQQACDLVRNWPRPEFPLSGRDAIACGLQPGPELGQTLRAVEAWWIAGDFAGSREHCIDALKRQVKQGKS